MYSDIANVTSPSTAPWAITTSTQLQRGLQVFREVCSACHSLKYVSFRDFKDLGYSDGGEIAQNWPTETPSINPETGEGCNAQAAAAGQDSFALSERGRRALRATTPLRRIFRS